GPCGYLSASREHFVCSLPVELSCRLPERQAPVWLLEIASIAFR
ncbi:MAG: hypothetical protein FD142_3185, partial [bacterium]